MPPSPPTTLEHVITVAVRAALAKAPVELIQDLGGLAEGPRDAQALIRLAVRISDAIEEAGFTCRPFLPNHIVQMGLIVSVRAVYDLTSKDSDLRLVAERTIAERIANAFKAENVRLIRKAKLPPHNHRPKQITLAQAKRQGDDILLFYCCSPGEGRIACSHRGEMPIDEAIARWGGGMRLDQVPVICSKCGTRLVDVRGTNSDIGPGGMPRGWTGRGTP